MKFEFKSYSGKNIVIDAEVKAEIANIDYSEAGAQMEVVRHEAMYYAKYAIYVDGKKVNYGSLSNPKEWGVKEIVKAQEKFYKLPAGTKCIFIGSAKIAFNDNETAERYTAWLNNLIEAGTPTEVKAFEKKQEIASLRHEIAKADRAKETGHFVPTEKEAKTKRKALMDYANEESIDFYPDVYSAEKLEKVKARLAELECA